MATLINFVPCVDMNATIQWYCQALGFKLVPDPLYAGHFAHLYLDGSNARSSRAQLMLRPFSPDKDGSAATGSKPHPMDIFFDVTPQGVDAKYKEIKATGVDAGLKDEPKDGHADYRMFDLTDPNGHHIVFFAWI